MVARIVMRGTIGVCGGKTFRKSLWQSSVSVGEEDRLGMLARGMLRTRAALIAHSDLKGS